MDVSGLPYAVCAVIQASVGITLLMERAPNLCSEW